MDKDIWLGKIDSAGEKGYLGTPQLRISILNTKTVGNKIIEEGLGTGGTQSG